MGPQFSAKIVRDDEKIGSSVNVSLRERAPQTSGEAVAVPPATEESFIRLTSTFPRILLYRCKKPTIVA